MCSDKTLEMMEINIKNETCRNMLKKALNNYCQYVNEHLAVICKGKIIPDDQESDENSIECKWRRSTYKIVISIVRILRIEFEAVNNVIDIELVIYFYELLQVKYFDTLCFFFLHSFIKFWNYLFIFLQNNIDNLTYSDAVNIADKLMIIVVKINEWSVNQEGEIIFTKSQLSRLKLLTFELSIKFISSRF
jgi:hypothetical protein